MIKGRWILTVAALSLFAGGCSWTPMGSMKGDAQVQSPPAVKDDSTLRYFYFMEAQSQEKKGNLDKEIYYLGKAIELDPDSNFLKRELAVAYLKQSNTEQAAKLILSILDQNPKEIESLFLLGRIHIAEKQYEKAAAVYEKALTIDPLAENIYYFLGNYYFEKNDLDNATRIYNQLISKKPEAYAAHFYLARILMKKGDYEGAEEKLLYTIEIAPDLEAPKKELIKIYEATGQEEKIIAVYQEMWDQNPDDFKSAASLALMYNKLRREGERDAVLADMASQMNSDEALISVIVNDYIEKERYPEALVLVDGMLKAGSENTTLYYLGGMVEDKLKNFKTAIDYFMKVPQDSRFYKSSVVQIAYLYQELGMTDTAVGFIENRLSISPDVSEFWLYYGTLLEEQKRLDAAVSAVRRGLVREPKNAALHFRLGTILDKQGDKDASIEQMRIVISIEPENANALNYLGYTLADMGIELDEAEELIRKALKIKPDDGYITDSLGWVLFKKGRYPEAVEQLEKALKSVQEDPVILEHLGDAYKMIGDIEKSIDYYQRSVKKQKEPSKELLEKIKLLSPKSRP